METEGGINNLSCFGMCCNNLLFRCCFGYVANIVGTRAIVFLLHDPSWVAVDVVPKSNQPSLGTVGRHNKATAKTVSRVVVVVVVMVMGTEDFLCDVVVFFFVWLENGAVVDVVVVVVVMGTEDFLCDVLVFFFVWLENGAVVDVWWM